MFGKIGLCDVTNLTKSVPKTLLHGFCALSRDIGKTCLATNDGE